MRRTLLGIITLMLAGCAPGNPGLVISNVISPDDQCLYTTTGPAITTGYFDVAVANNSYQATFRFWNQLVNLSQTGTAGFPVMADPNVMLVQSLEIELRDLTGAPLALGADFPNPYAIPSGAVTIPSGDGMMAGEAVGTAVIIPEVYTAEIAAVAGTDATIVVAITAIGTTTGGAEVVSFPFVFPIQLCSGCLSTCLTDEEGMNICRPSCTPGQDEVHIACDASCVAGTT